MWRRIKKTFRSITVAILAVTLFLSGFPSAVLLERVGRIGETITDRNVVDTLYHATKKTRDANIIDKGLAELLRPRVEKAQAATYQMQTGYYIGNGASKSITGLGFSPQMIVIKSNTTATVALLKTTAMPAVNTAYLGSATADSTAGLTALNADGFTVTGAANTANARYTWTAFTGSDCSASGVFCIGSYQGTAAAKAITTGFQPDLILVKAATAVSPSWRSSAMPASYGQYFEATIQNTAGALFTTIDATGFTVGATNSPTGATVYYAAFKQVAGSVKVGTYTGAATPVDNTNIAGVGFVPDWMFIKNAPTAVAAVQNVKESYGDSSGYFTAIANLVDSIQELRTDGFQVGLNATVNSANIVYYYAAFTGAAAHSSGSGTFKMASGSYTGTGAVQTINNIGFSPDLVIIKGNTTQAGAFRTRMMGGDVTAYLDSATADFAGGITSLNPDGFTVGTSVAVNTNAITYYWTAYGNAWNPDTNSGASDFFIGAYYGNGIDSRNITRLPFQPNLVTVKRSGASGGAFRTSAHSGDLTSYFTATADAANIIQTFNADGFQIGTAANTNTAANNHWYFGFKNGTNFTVNSYTGTGASQNITSVGFQPDNIWVKAATAQYGVSRTSGISGDGALPFINTASIANAITGIISTGFTVNTAAQTNSNTVAYKYVAWKNNSTPTTPVYKMQTGSYMGSGASKSITGLGFSPQMVVIKSNTTAIAAVFKTTAMPAVNTAYLGSATADNTAGLTALNADGFTVTGVANTANVRYTWTAFTGSDCSASGVFCIGSYLGAGSGTKAVNTVGFQPDLVWVKAGGTSTVSPTWRSSAMPANYGQYFAATAQDTAGALFTTLDATGFTVGLTNNAAVTYYYAAFKQVAGSVKVGTYTGNAFDNTNITGVGFVPDWMFAKNAPTAVSAVYNIKESYGDSSSYFSATANIPNIIQELRTDGFQVGTNSTSNGLNNTIYYAAFAGAAAYSSGSGTFQMVSGSYTGTAQVQSIGNIGFSPDLVIIKGNTTQAGAFRTRMMAGDITAYLDSATTNFANGITALNPDGFTVGIATAVNTNAITYYWTAYGNAWNPDTNSGSADFTIGAYYGNGIDDRDITRLPFKPDMVAIKVYAATAGVFRTSAHSGDLTSYFCLTSCAEAANLVQSLNNDGFRVGSAGNVNANASLHYFFAFKSGANFTVGNYTGTGASQNITSVGFQPDYIWIKRTTAVQGVSRTSAGAADSALPFINVASITNAITGIISTGFTVNTATETNASGGNYRYVAWKSTIGLVFPDATSVTYTVSTDGGRSGDSITITGTNFGTVADGSQANCSGGSDTGCVRFIVGGNDTVADVNVASWSATSIVFTVSTTIASNGGAAGLQVVAASRADASPLTFYIYPRISSITNCTTLPAGAYGREYAAADTACGNNLKDGEVVATGDHLGSAGTVTILGSTATQAIVTGFCGGAAYSSTCISLQVPTAIADNAYTGDVVATRTSDSKTDTLTGFRVLPRITGFTPTSQAEGGAVTVDGNHFCQNGGVCPTIFDANNKVTFYNAKEAATFTSWTSTTMSTAVPTGAEIGNVILKSNGYDSNGKNFVVLSNTPSIPSALGQFKNSGFTQSISVGASASSTPIYLKQTMEVQEISGGTLYPQFEYKLTGTSFACGAGACGSAVEGTGSAGPGPATGSVSISPADGTYHWQARTRHNKTSVDYYSAWVSFGGNNDPSDTDFKIDTTAPAITNVSHGSPSSNFATITWDTSGEQSSTQVQYNTTGTFVTNCATNNDCTTITDIPPSGVFNHSQIISNLGSGVTYYYRARSKDEAGNETIGTTYNFTTSSITQPGKTNSFFIVGSTTPLVNPASDTYYFSIPVPETSPSMKNAFVEIAGIVSGGSNPITIQTNQVASRAYAVSATNPTPFTFIYEIGTPTSEANLNINDEAPCTNGAGAVAPCNKFVVTPGSGMTVYITSARIVVTYGYTP